MISADDAIGAYFRLKGDYDKDLQRRRKSIIRSTRYTDTEKRRKLANLKGKCSNCGLRGNMKFSQNGTFLVATCADGHCPLEIRIDRGKVAPLLSLISSNIEARDQTQEDIICTKLNLVFAYTTEAETVEKFKKLKTKYMVAAKKLEGLVKSYDEYSTDSSVQLELQQFEDDLAMASNALHEIEKGDYTDKAQRMVKVLIEDIMPIARRITRIRYPIMRVENVESADGKPVTKLVQQRMSYADSFVTTRKASVIKYVR